MTRMFLSLNQIKVLNYYCSIFTKFIFRAVLISCHNLNEVFTVKILGVSLSRMSPNNSCTDHSINHGNSFLNILELNYTIMLCCVNIQNIVGNVSSRVVDLLKNVQPLSCNSFCDSCQSTRHIFVYNCESYCSLRSFIQESIREIDTVLDFSSFKVGHNSLCCHGSCSILSLFSRSTKMRHDDSFLMIPEQVIWKIRDISTISTIQEVLHSFRIN
mmetsp:Transcript_22386/g.41690  ORF Transcript_22386/g.41690 Transcript_22386/m.41690 type:complete len:215 (-) Transcript_22386:1195-1839(-)